jgi:UDP-GlcNAc:undecaprenyl-phosphate/decaprenyl-phosphate GlcNAc-1-phosphate transferase
MDLNLILDYIVISIIASLAVNMILRNLAHHYNLLIDIPNKSRKFHKRQTPVTGGLGILVSVLISGKLYLDLNGLNGYMPDFSYYLILTSIFVVILFLFDDIKNIKASQKLSIQIIATLLMILFTDVYISSLGDLFGNGDIHLGHLGVPFTVFCVVGIMNAFNMIDGINGLSSGCAMVALLFIGFKSGLIYDSMLILLIGSMIGFLVFNLSILGKKRAIFLGDHGSNLIGYWVAWSAIYSSQTSSYEILPITLIWFVAIPLLDCVGLIFSRYHRGISYKTAGRDHIHHRLMNKFSAEGTLVIIVLISIFLCIFGLLNENYFSSKTSMLLFIIFSFVYYLFAYYYDFIIKIIRGSNV